MYRVLFEEQSSFSLSLQFECFCSLSLVFMKEGELKERQQQSSQMPFPFLAKSHHILPSHTSSLFFTQLFIKATLHPSLLHQRPSRLPPSTYHSFGFTLSFSISFKSHPLAVHPSNLAIWACLFERNKKHATWKTVCMLMSVHISSHFPWLARSLFSERSKYSKHGPSL